MSTDLMKDVETIASHDLNGRHSYFQLQHFLIGKEPTIQAKLWRCVRELQARKDTINSIKLEIEEVEDRLEIINTPTTVVIEDKYAIRHRERLKKSIGYKLEELKRRLEGLEQEANFFVLTFKALETVEKIKPYDDLESQKLYWETKLKLELKIKESNLANHDPEVIKTVLALPDDSQLRREAIFTIGEYNDVSTLNIK